MKKPSLISIALTMLAVLSMFAGRDYNNVPPGDHPAATEEMPADDIYAAFPERLSAEKINSIELNNIYTGKASGGIYYKGENGKYGIMTLDGKSDTGAVYAYCSPVGKYFKVSFDDFKAASNVEGLNCIGLVDATGKEIFPMSYATIEQLNERFFRVCEAKGQTTKKSEELVYYNTNDSFSFSFVEGEARFKGNWYICDVTTGKPVNGVTGTTPHIAHAYGNFIEYVTDEKTIITANDKGEHLPEGAELFINGYYTVVKDGIGTVCNSNGEEVFNYALDGFVPTQSDGNFIVAAKREDTMKYVLMDFSGNIVSPEFNNRPTVCGSLVFAGNKLCKPDGTPIIDGNYTKVATDAFFEKTWLLENDSEYILIKEDGAVLYQGAKDGSVSVTASPFCISKKVNNKTMYYSFADKDFTLEGASDAPWLVKVQNSDGLFNIVDSISGETIISGYSDYTYVSIPNSSIYVYAKKNDGGIDIYKVK